MKTSNHNTIFTVKNIDDKITTPYQFFQLFFNNTVLEEIAKNTNLYAKHKKEKYIKTVISNIEDNMSDDEIEDNMSDVEMEENCNLPEEVRKSKNLKSSMKWKDTCREELEKFISNSL